MAYWQQVTQGSVLDAGQAQELDSALYEGQRGKLEIDLRVSPGADVVRWLQNELNARGVTDARVSSGSPDLVIEFRKTFFWLPVIIALVLALVILIVGWRFYREIIDVVPEDVRGAVVAGGTIALVIFAGLAAYLVLKPKGR